MHWAFVIHTIGLIFWVGGLLILTRFANVTLTPGAATPHFVTTLRKCWFIYVVQGFALVLLSGMYQLFAGGGPGFYFKQGWFHGKITLVLVLIVATVMLGFEIKKIAESIPASAGRLRAIQIMSIISLLGIIVLTKALRA